MTESLAAFVTAERLVDQNEAVNEAAVEQAMLDAQARQASINAKINARGNGQSEWFTHKLMIVLTGSV